MSMDFAVHGPELHIPIPKQSLAKLIHQSMLQNLNEIAFIDGITEETISFKDVLVTACRLSNSLQNAGYTKNDLLGICSENIIHFFSPLIAGLYMGMIIVPISHHYSEGEMNHSINITRPKIIFCSKNTVAKCVTLKENNKCIEKLIVMGVDDDVPGTETLNKFIMRNCNESVNIREFCPVDAKDEDLTMFIVFSSGTTGLPKGAMITQMNCLMRIVHAYDPRIHFESLGSSANLGYLPFYHTSGLMITLAAIVLGKPTIVLPKFEENLFLNCIQKYKISSIALVPTLLVLLSKSSNIDKYDLSSLKSIVCGAAPISAALEKQIKDKLKLESVRQLYGMTETTYLVIAVPHGVEKHGSVGTVTAGMVCAVKDPDSHTNLGPNRVGELCFKGWMVMKGYYDKNERPVETFTHDGWLKTGDLGYYDNDGYFYIVDRLKELIKYKSFQVPPTEIEALLLKHPKIKEVAVIGVPDERAGELPLAFVVKQPNFQLTESEVIEYVANHLSRHKHLHGGVRFIDELPKNMSGKIIKRKLKQMVKGEINDKR